VTKLIIAFRNFANAPEKHNYDVTNNRSLMAMIFEQNHYAHVCGNHAQYSGVLGMFAKLRKATISFVTAARPH
jgi:translation elongation factor EF-Tu-like GTPase